MPVVGDWNWFTGAVVQFGADHRAVARATLESPVLLEADWYCDWDNSEITLAWRNGIEDTLRLSADNNQLQGQNRQGVLVSAVRLGTGAPASDLATNLGQQAAVAQGQVEYELGNYTSAFRIWEPLARQGVAAAQAKLGRLYQDGQGVSQDYWQAADWYRQAAVQGDLDATFHLAVLYQEGNGTEQDYKEAWRLVQIAADGGHIMAINHVGVFYFNGWVVEQDYAEAIQWFRRAANQGVPQAEYNMGVVYENGLGVNQDLSEAAIWYGRAGNGFPAGAERNTALEAYNRVYQQPSAPKKQHSSPQEDELFQQALKAFEAGDVEGAKALWLQLAEGGHRAQ